MYRLNLFAVIISRDTGEEVDTITESEDFETRQEAEQAAEKYHKGDVLAVYGDGARAIIEAVEISAVEEDEDI